MKKILLLSLFGLFFGFQSYAQQDLYWRSDATTSNWWDNSNPWYRTCDGWWLGRPDYNTCSNNSTIGGNYIHFDNNNNVSMTVNGAWFKLFTLTFETTATTARTLTADGTGGLSFTSTISYITNKSTTTHVLSTGIGVDNSTLTVNALNGSLTFNNVIYVNANSITFTGGNAITVGGVISGSGTLTKSGAGTLTLTGANTYTGLTTISAGTLKLYKTGGTTIPATNNVTVSGGTLQVSSDQTIANLDLSGGGSLSVDAGVTLTITGTYTGGTGTINNLGTIVLQGAAAQSFPGNSTVINNGTAGQMTNLTINNSNGVSLDKSFTVSGTLLINPAAELTLNSGSSLTTSTFTINSSASGTGTFVDLNAAGGLTVSGTTSVDQYLSTNRNWYICSPLSGAASDVFAASGSNPLYYYVENNPNVWSQITNTSTSLGAAMTGYIANISSDRNVTFTGTGQVLYNGAQSISGLTRQEVSFKGFNLIGNPYVSYYDWDHATLTNVSSSIWYRSKSTGAYLFQTYNSLGGVGTLGGTKYIPPMQAFWVQVTSGTGTVAFVNAYRSHLNQSVATNRLKAPATGLSTQQLLRLNVSNGISSDETVLYSNAAASNNYDAYDSQKMSNSDATIPEIYTLAGTEALAINGLNTIPLDTEIPLGFTTGEQNSFTIKVNEMSNFDSGIKLILKDKLNTDVDITNGAAYSFTSSATSTTGRFSVIFKTAGTTTAVNTSTGNVSTLVYKNNNNQIIIDCSAQGSTATIYNSIGQKVTSKIITDKISVISTPMLSGVYFVNIKGNGYETTKKIILN